MKLTLATGELLKGLARIQAIVEKRNSMPILANVLLEALTEKNTDFLQFSATDLEVGICARHPAEVAAAGALTVGAKKLFEIVRELPEDVVHLEATANSYLDIRCARAKFTLAGTAADEYPTLPSFSPERTVPVQPTLLSTMIERTMYAASVDETRYNLNGVYLEVLPDTGKSRMVATDGHRLALIDRSLGTDGSGLMGGVIIPRKGLIELKRLLDENEPGDVNLAFEGNSGLAKRGDVTLIMRLIEGEFPNYRQVIPDAPGSELVLPTEQLIHALRRVVLLSTERSRAVSFDLSAGQLVISSNNPDLGDARDEIDVVYTGEPISIGLNARYLLDALATTHAKEVRIGLHNDLSPVQVVPTNDEDTLAVVMPMRI